jgi:hypothetical protein
MLDSYQLLLSLCCQDRLRFCRVIVYVFVLFDDNLIVFVIRGCFLGCKYGWDVSISVARYVIIMFE